MQASRSQGHGKNVCGDRTTLLQYTLMRRQRKMHILHKQLQGILTRVKFMVVSVDSVQSSSTRLWMVSSPIYFENQITIDYKIDTFQKY